MDQFKIVVHFFSLSHGKCFNLNVVCENEHVLCIFFGTEKIAHFFFQNRLNLSVTNTTEHYDNHLYLQEKIKTVMQHCFNCVKNKLEAKVGYFELYGYDFMIDTNFNVSN